MFIFSSAFAGFGSFLSGIFGPGVGMTTHTENIGVIGVTRVKCSSAVFFIFFSLHHQFKFFFQVASRFTMVIAGVFLILLGTFTKIGAILATIPDPLVGGVLASSMAMVGGVAIANLQQVCIIFCVIKNNKAVNKIQGF